uniref:NOP2/Sun RNA methyltransferase 3 n=1 Tax=Sander lucioperca TaxID=283035 RepID=A0A8C9XQR9_SANLU
HLKLECTYFSSKRSLCQQVLERFDQQYSQELGDLWPSARAVLLDPHSWQYGVMLNRFTTVTGITQILQSQGFSTLLPQTCPPNDSHLQPDSTSHELCQDLQSEPSLSSPRPTLQCYIHPYPLRFPSQAHRPGQLKQYYLLNAASLLPVLALQIRDGEKVLDLCSAPGGKALAITQCATPGNASVFKGLCKLLFDFIYYHTLDYSHFLLSLLQVLVDAPCSNDRSWLYSCSSQQGEQRLKERARLPALQTQLLRSALSAVRPGGAVVYSTCTLSSSENCAVVETVLNDCPENGTSSPYRHRLGILVVPQLQYTAMKILILKMNSQCIL